MPFILACEYDSDEPSEQSEESDEYEYMEPSHGRLDSKYINGATAHVLAALKAAGATHFRVDYDGGCDEGFSYPSAIFHGANEFSITAIVSILSQTSLVQEIRLSNASNNWYARSSPQQIIQSSLDDLADAYATSLLEEGFGTGEMFIYGQFTADLITGEIVDNPSAIRRRKN